ncbi:BTAD domain-containing putative transcriptional regulator [Actinoplanes sp. NPDC051513]|uniref:AfsR/SARP family transcriptional regulator n=1 Tax=Actinoplanes sp. NPDC051513 TaxID=3363908 RepID=UPI00379A7B14
MLSVGVLGPLQVRVGERAVEITTGRLRALLAVLAMSAGRPAPVERLATAVWGENLPDDARRSVRTYVTRLRSLLGGDVIETTPDGYLLHARVDALSFVRLLESSTAEPERAAVAEALALWRGAPFEGIRAAWLEDVEAPRLAERRLDAVERRIELDLAAGRPGDLVGELRDLTARHPLRETFWAQLMVALYRSGRQVEALATYQRLYRLLADEAGVEPGPGVQRLHRRMIRADPTLHQARHTPAAAPVPQQLPAGVAGFTGQQRGLDRLDRLLEHTGDAAAVAVVTGGAGTGKTALAVHWAHRFAHRFPDGQLYLDLRGAGPSGPALAPDEGLRALIEAFGVPPARVPGQPDAQVGLYRSLLAGKRVLVLLDNAADAGQARPLLPGAPGCAGLVTSRHQLPGLVAEGACPVTPEPLDAGEARDLLAARLGAARLDAEPDATDRIVAWCAGLPLALALVAGRAATQPQSALAAVADELRETGGDTATDLRSVFSWSYAAVTPAARRLFRMLSAHPGPDIALAAAAGLAGLPAPQARPALRELCQAHLLTEHAPGRYALHDLLRAYAAELFQEQDGEGDRHAAERRILDHYRSTAGAAAQLIEAEQDTVAGRDQALAWFDAELSPILGAVALARALGRDDDAGELARSLADYLQWQ